MKWSQIISLVGLGGLASCHAPLLLTELSPETKPLEKYKLYNPNFELAETSALRIDGFYFSKGEERKVPFSLKQYQEAKKNNNPPAGFELSELSITKDTILIVYNIYTLQFFKNGTYSSRVYTNKTIEEIYIDKKQLNETIGNSVYKLDENQINYEFYSKMSGFNYAQGKVTQDSVTFGNSDPYQFTQF